jgi:curli biogenesis system outer membrane secretion channel CsgG
MTPTTGRQGAIIYIIALLLAGCSTGGGGSSTDNVGQYSAAPTGANRPRLGIATFRADDDPGRPLGSAGLGEVAADELAVLLGKTGRFEVVGRAEVASLLERQGLTDLVRPGVMVGTAPLPGVDYLLVGSLTNLSIHKRAESPDVMDRMKNFVRQMPQNKDVAVTLRCGVGLSIVDPGTGDVVVTNNSELDRTGPAEELGLDVMESMAATQPGAALPVSEADREQVVRLALDDAIRKSLPKIDRFLASRAGGATALVPVAEVAPAAAAATAPTTGSMTAPAPPTGAASQKPCPTCSTPNDSAATFCRRCGGRL